MQDVNLLIESAAAPSALSAARLHTSNPCCGPFDQFGIAWFDPFDTGACEAAMAKCEAERGAGEEDRDREPDALRGVSASCDIPLIARESGAAAPVSVEGGARAVDARALAALASAAEDRCCTARNGHWLGGWELGGEKRE